jgi:TolB protein
MKRAFLACIGVLLGAGVYTVAQQRPEISGTITGGEKPKIAIPDFRGSGGAERFMSVFNDTLWNEIAESGLFNMAPKSMYPLQVPQQPSDFRPPTMPATAPRRGRSVEPVRNGPWLTDWSGPPLSAQWLAFGYTGVRNDQIVLFGWLYNVLQPSPSAAQVIGKLYFGPLSEEGARDVARQFAADILQQFGGKSLAGTKIYFTSDRTGHKEIWSMDYDGSNQKQVTNYRSISTFPCVSPDGGKVAFTSYYQGNPRIVVHSTETGRRLPFYNQTASLNAPSDFTPDGKQLLLYSTANGGFAHIYIANVDGSSLRPISPPGLRAIEVEAKVNPKTGSDLVFVSGRSGPPQIYRMNIDGADIVRLTDGQGEAVNPSWHPDGQKIAFAWTRGFEPGNYNIFIMDVVSRTLVQLTHGAGRNENPVWAPDGQHIVFSSTRGRSTQIYTMLADGTQVKQLTTQGNNQKPVWGKGSF